MPRPLSENAAFVKRHVSPSQLAKMYDLSYKYDRTMSYASLNAEETLHELMSAGSEDLVFAMEAIEAFAQSSSAHARRFAAGKLPILRALSPEVGDRLTRQLSDDSNVTVALAAERTSGYVVVIPT